MSGRHERSLTYWEQVARTGDKALYLRWCEKYQHDPAMPFAAERFVASFSGMIEPSPDQILSGWTPVPKHRGAT